MNENDNKLGGSGTPGVTEPAAPAPVAAPQPAASAAPLDVDSIVDRIVSHPRMQAALGAANASTTAELREIKAAQLAADGKWEELARLRAEDNARLQRQINETGFSGNLTAEIARRLAIPTEAAAAIAANVPFAEGDIGAIATRYITANRQLVDLVVAGTVRSGAAAAQAATAAAAIPAPTNAERIFPGPASGPAGGNPAAVEPGVVDSRSMDPAAYARHKAAIIGQPMANRLGGRRLRAV